MSWFDQLFGENDKDQSSQRSTRRRKSEATREEKHASFVQQSQDVYQRPRGKFRFPIEMHDEVVERHHQQADTTQTQDVTMHTQLHERRPSFTVDRQHRRHRGVQQARCYEQQQTRGSNSTHSNSHQNDYTFAAQSSQHSKKQNVIVMILLLSRIIIKNHSKRVKYCQLFLVRNNQKKLKTVD